MVVKTYFYNILPNKWKGYIKDIFIKHGYPLCLLKDSYSLFYELEPNPFPRTTIDVNIPHLDKPIVTINVNGSTKSYILNYPNKMKG